MSFNKRLQISVLVDNNFKKSEKINETHTQRMKQRLQFTSKVTVIAFITAMIIAYLMKYTTILKKVKNQCNSYTKNETEVTSLRAKLMSLRS